MSRVEPFQMFSVLLVLTPEGTVMPAGIEGPLVPIQGRNMATSSTTAPIPAISCPRVIRPIMFVLRRSCVRAPCPFFLFAGFFFAGFFLVELVDFAFDPEREALLARAVAGRGVG